MNRKLIINGNEVYEIDEDCMLKRGLCTEGECSQDRAEHTGDSQRQGQMKRRRE